MRAAPLPQVQALLQEAAPDTAAADTAAVNSAATDTAAADSTGLFQDAGDAVAQAGELIVTGQWEQLLEAATRTLGEKVGEFLPLLIKALLVFLLFYVLFRIVDSVLKRVMYRALRSEPGLVNLLLKTYRIAGWALIVVLVLEQFAIDATALLAGLSIVGIAVGFAARDSLENFISGITILLDKPFRIGDNLTIDSTYGTVEDITLRSTRLRTLNNEIMVMPNIQMINQKVINHSLLGLKRIEVPFGIAYKEYPDEARRVVLALTEGDDRMHPDFPPSVVVTGLNDSSVDMSLRLFLRNPKEEVAVRLAYIEKVREGLREADIEIPFPHLQLFIDEAKALERASFMRSSDAHDPSS